MLIKSWMSKKANEVSDTITLLRTDKTIKSMRLLTKKLFGNLTQRRSDVVYSSSANRLNETVTGKTVLVYSSVECVLCCE